MVSFPEAIRLFFRRYTDFQGRSRRSEFWWVQLFNLIIGAVGVGLFWMFGGSDLSGTGEINPLGLVFLGLLGVYGLAILIPSIALFVRRLHDINQTGWIYLGIVVISLLPLIGLLGTVATIVIGVIPGTVGENKYGPDPKSPSVSADVFV